MYSVSEKLVEVKDFNLDELIKEGTYGEIWKANLKGGSKQFLVKIYEKITLIENGYV